MSESSDIDAVLSELIPILFSHSCRTERSHALHAELSPYFREMGMDLLRDPFKPGEDVMVAMKRLQIHGVVIHITPESVDSAAVRTELDTARRMGAPIMNLKDGALIPEDLRNRISVSFSKLKPGERSEKFRELA